MAFESLTKRTPPASATTSSRCGTPGNSRSPRAIASSSTPAARAAAVAAYADEPVHLILGGSLKGEDFGPFARELGPRVRRAYLIGEAADELTRALEAAAVPHERSGDLATAVRDASAVAEPGEVVLLSPACASYDQFENFERRGEEFRRLVQNLS